MTLPVILWFRFDLRLADNPALAEAAVSGRPVVPVFILDDESPGRWRLGGASRWWLAGSLAALDESLKRLGSRLILRRGEAGATLAALARDAGATEVLCNRVHEPWAAARDERVSTTLAENGIGFRAFEASLLFPPETMPGPKGVGYRVFTPFWKACLAKPAPSLPMPAPKRLVAPERWPGSDVLDSWRLRPTKPDWAAGLRASWTPGELDAGRGGRAGPAGLISRRSASRLRRGPRPAGPLGNLAPLAAPEVWGDKPAPDLACGDCPHGGR